MLECPICGSNKISPYINFMIDIYGHELHLCYECWNVFYIGQIFAEEIMRELKKQYKDDKKEYKPVSKFPTGDKND